MNTGVRVHSFLSVYQIILSVGRGAEGLTGAKARAGSVYSRSESGAMPDSCLHPPGSGESPTPLACSVLPVWLS